VRIMLELKAFEDAVVSKIRCLCLNRILKDMNLIQQSFGPLRDKETLFMGSS
jgi:hypothetical protein